MTADSKNRQYIFELTEEYLPDRYLQEVYAPATIQSIAREIDRAVLQYVSTACAALGIDTPDVIDAGTITELVTQLDAELTAFASREAILSQDTTYEERRSQFEQRQKELAAAQKSLSRLNAEREELNRRLETLDRSSCASGGEGRNRKDRTAAKRAMRGCAAGAGADRE